MASEKNTKWYANGLHFECNGCGGCCSGPEEGYVWITKVEIGLVSDFLKVSEDEFRRDFVRKCGARHSLLEKSLNKDCVFLQKVGGGKGCAIYPVRPNQCRTWPFWTSNLASPNAWNETLKHCWGINTGRHYSVGEIEELRKQKKWWEKD